MPGGTKVWVLYNSHYYWWITGSYGSSPDDYGVLLRYTQLDPNWPGNVPADSLWVHACVVIGSYEYGGAKKFYWDGTNETSNVNFTLYDGSQKGRKGCKPCAVPRHKIPTLKK